MTAVSRIGLRLFTFNLLVVFVPVTGMLYLDVYEAQLRRAQEASLAAQAGVVAAALIVTVGLGLAGTLLALNQKPATVLRNL